MGRFKAKPDEILLPGYLPDFTPRLISEPIVQRRRHLWGGKGEKVLLKSGKKPKPWVRRVKEPDSEDFGQLFDRKRRNEVEKFAPQLLIVMMRIGLS